MLLMAFIVELEDFMISFDSKLPQSFSLLYIVGYCLCFPMRFCACRAPLHDTAEIKPSNGAHGYDSFLVYANKAKLTPTTLQWDIERKEITSLILLFFCCFNSVRLPWRQHLIRNPLDGRN